MLCCFGVPVPVYLVPVPLPHCMWVLVPLCVVPVPLPLQMLPFTIALPGASRQRLPSIAMIYICSLDTNPYKKCARNSKNLHKHKNARDDQRNLFLHKMGAKHELRVLKSYINVALLCIQQWALLAEKLKGLGIKWFPDEKLKKKSAGVRRGEKTITQRR